MSSVLPPPPPPEPVPSVPPAPSVPQVPSVPAMPPVPTDPPVAPAPTSAVPAAPTLPPQAPPTSGGSSTKLALIVGLGIVVTLVVLAGALFALFSTLSNSVGDNGSDGGTPTLVADGPPCDGCVAFEDVLALRPDGAIPTLALEFDSDTGYAKPSVVGSYADSSKETFQDGGGFPLGCAFAIDYAPVSPSSPDDDSRADRIGDLGSFFNDTDYLSMVARVFENEADAAAYPETLRAGIADCPHYSFTYSDGADYWETDVEPLEFTTSSPAVTAVGWHENSNGSDLIIVDLQYSNVTVRSVYSRTADSAATEEQLRAFVLELSASLEALGR